MARFKGFVFLVILPELLKIFHRVFPLCIDWIDVVKWAKPDAIMA